MKQILLLFFFIVYCATYIAAQKVFVIKIDGAVNPASAAFIKRSIDKASSAHASCLVIELNTPGGLLKSTRVIVTSILEAEIPVVVYVAPAGAHAGSAGVFITLAAHIAAMAPGTNIGAAHPVDLQGQTDTIMNAKATNDASAFIRTIAEKRNRNIQWAEKAVRQSISVTESEALKEHIIDLVTPGVSALLDSIDGKQVDLPGRVVTLRTRDAETVSLEMGWTEKILDLISDPTVAYILLLLGLYGILFELYNPGAILPGIVGVIAFVLAFYSMHTLPVNYAGVALIVFGVILLILEVKVVSHGMLAIGGIVSLLLGSMMLIRPDSELEMVSISKLVIFTAVILTTLFFLFLVGAGIRAQKTKPVTGREGLLQETGISLETLDPYGLVRIHGEIWKAESVAGKIEKGEKLRVVSMQNLRLKVTHISS